MPREGAHHYAGTLASLVRRVAARLGVRFFSLYYGEKNLDGPIPDVKPPEGVQIAQASPDDLRNVLGKLDPSTRKAFQHATDIGSTCFVAKRGEEVVGYSWLNRRVVDLLGLTVTSLPEDMGYLHTSYVFPEFRGKKIFQCLTRAIEEDLKAKGCRFACNLVGRDNAASIAARRNLGSVFQKTSILKLPGLPPIFLGRPFVMGGSARRKS